MKLIPLLLTLALPALAQDTLQPVRGLRPVLPPPLNPSIPSPTTPPEPVPVVLPAPAVPAAPADRPDLKPAKPEPRVTPSDLRPTAPDLPPLPAATNKDLPKKKDGSEADIANALVPEKVTTNKKPAPGSTGNRPKNRTALLPPQTPGDLDLRVRYRVAHTKASTDPAVRAAWEDSRDAHTDFAKRAALKNYYELLNKKILAIDKGVAPISDDRSHYYIRRITQSRVAPTEEFEREGLLDN